MIAGPWFGITDSQRKDILKIWNDDKKEKEFRVQNELREWINVRDHQLAAIARYQLIIDASPWRAFARWSSVGFRNPSHGEPEALVKAPCWWIDLVKSPESSARFEKLLTQSIVRDRVKSLLDKGQIALAGWNKSSISVQAAKIVSAIEKVSPKPTLVVPKRELNAKVHSDLPVSVADEPVDGLLDSPSVEQYKRLVQVVCGQVKLPGEPLEFPLKDVFVELACEQQTASTSQRHRLSNKDRPPLVTDELLHERELLHQEDRWSESGSKTSRTIRPDQLLTIGDKVYLEGTAGTGKSTLLKWLAVSLAQQDNGPIPIWVRLSSLGVSIGTEQVVRAALQDLGVQSNTTLESTMIESIGQKQVVLLLDGLDEASETVRNSFFNEHPVLSGARQIISSRPVRQSEAIAVDWKEVRLWGLIDKSARQFFVRYFGPQPWTDRAITGLQHLRDGQRWMRTPVFLVLVAALYSADKELPDSILELYEVIVSHLVDTARTRLLITQASAKKARLELQDLAKEWLLPVTPDKPVRFSGSRRELRSLEHYELIRTTGLLMIDDRVRFVHLTLGEFLAAKAAIENDTNGDRLERFLDLLAPQVETGGTIINGEAVVLWLAIVGEPALDLVLKRVKESPLVHHGWLRLLLRALSYAGVVGKRFAQRNQCELLEIILDRIENPYGRWSNQEDSLMDIVVKVAWLWKHAVPQHLSERISVLRHLLGACGTWSWMLWWSLGNKATEIPRIETRLADRVVATLTNVGFDWVKWWPNQKGAALNVLEYGYLLAEDHDIQREFIEEFVCGNIQYAQMQVSQFGNIAGLLPLVRDKARSSPEGYLLLPNDPEVTFILKAALNDRDPTIRFEAAKALANLPEASSILKDALNDDSLYVRIEAARALTNLPEASSILKDALNDDSPYVRIEAARALTNLPEATLVLKEAFKHKDQWVRIEVAEALADFPEASSILKDALNDESPYVRRGTVRALANLPEASSILKDALNDIDPTVRIEAAKALANLPEALSVLKDALNDIDPTVRVESAKALANLPDASSILKDALNDIDPTVRVEAAKALANLPDASSILKHALNDVDPVMRIEAVKALANLPEASSILKDALNDESPYVRRGTARALANLPEASSILKDALNDIDPTVRIEAVKALANLPEASSILKDALNDIAPTVRIEAAKALANLPEASSILKDALNDESQYVRIEAAKALINLPEASSILKAALNDERPYVRIEAAKALINLPEATSILKDALNYKEPYLRREAAKALANLPEATSILKDAINDEDPDVRIEAATILKTPEARKTLQALLVNSYDERLLAHDVLSDWRSAVQNHEILRLLSRVTTAAAIHTTQSQPKGIDPSEIIEQQQAEVFAKTPSVIFARRSTQLYHALRYWLLMRLGITTVLPLHPEFPAPCVLGDYHMIGDHTHVIRVWMPAERLPKERSMFPVHNTIEAWRVARNIRVPRDKPQRFWLICANLDWNDLEIPSIEPGELHLGPVYYGFSLPLETDTDRAILDLPLLVRVLTTRTALEHYQQASAEEQRLLLDQLAALSNASELDEVALIPMLSRLSERLPDHVRKTLVDRLPSDITSLAERLDLARGQATSAPRLNQPEQSIARTNTGIAAQKAQWQRDIEALLTAPEIDLAALLKTLSEAQETFRSPENDVETYVSWLQRTWDSVKRTRSTAQKLLPIVRPFAEQKVSHRSRLQAQALLEGLETFVRR